MGMIVHVYRSAHGDCSNGGVSSRVKQLCVTNVEGPFQPTEDTPGAKLIQRARIGNLALEPDGIPDGAWTMFGGCYASTSDSRWTEAVQKLSGYPFAFPVPIFDRVE